MKVREEEEKQQDDKRREEQQINYVRSSGVVRV